MKFMNDMKPAKYTTVNGARVYYDWNAQYWERGTLTLPGGAKYNGNWYEVYGNDKDGKEYICIWYEESVKDDGEMVRLSYAPNAVISKN